MPASMPEETPDDETPDMARPAETVSSGLPTFQEVQALEDAVRTTLVNSEADGPVSPEEIAALQAVAKRHGHVPLTLDPVAIELVEAIVLVNYGHLQRHSEVWQKTAKKIATLLCDAPESHARLENLWHKLVESS